ncbi:protein TALPID3 [Tachyglossus aculeatus]|uniref:protein TALPID3 n=1 Tax=Tachyglossus aculeatus TaxID=9261 RepID=UPI0018F3CC99|nr:protein TALPID3 [Tachyglossus aculeatus]
MGFRPTQAYSRESAARLVAMSAFPVEEGSWRRTALLTVARVQNVMPLPLLETAMDAPPRAKSSNFCPSATPTDRRKHAPAQEFPLKESGRPQAKDLSIFQYSVGQKDLLRAALKQKAQNGPVPKEVKVQLLEDVCPGKDTPAAQQLGPSPAGMDSATTVAAATAAAIATAVPLIRVQSDLEAQVNSVSELLRKLQETDRRLQRAAERQAGVPERRRERDGLRDLEEQRREEQHLRLLEKLQQQQLDIQTHLIRSAFQTSSGPNLPPAAVPPPAPLERYPLEKYTVESESRRPLSNFSAAQSGPEVTAPSAGYPRQMEGLGRDRLKSPLETPAPRRYAPVPASRDAKVSWREHPAAEKENLHTPTPRGGMRLLEEILNNPDSSEKTALSKPKLGCYPERSGCREQSRAATQQAKSFPSCEEFGAASRTVEKANDVLRDLSQLKKEMNGILQEAKLWKSDMKDFIKQKDCPDPSRRPDAVLEPQSPSRFQSTQAPKSIVKEAARILKGVQNNRKVLEENLEAIIQAKDGTAMYSLISALAANSDAVDAVRIRKTVDEWIKAMSVEIQDEMARNDEQKKLDQKTERVSLAKKTQILQHSKVKKKVKADPPGKTGFSGPYPQNQTENRAGRQNRRGFSVSENSQKREERNEGLLKPAAADQREDHLTHVYGKPVYQGHRSTLKKGPYLRFNSPPPRFKPQRPRVVERLKGTRVRSAKTQTSSHPPRAAVMSLRRQRALSTPRLQEQQYLFSPSREMTSLTGALEGQLIPMAVPLGKTQSDRVSPQPIGVLIGKPHPVTVTTSIPPSVPKPQFTVKKPNVAVVTVKSQKKDPPQLTVQVLPNVDIDSISNGSMEASEMSHGPEAALDSVHIHTQAPEFSQHEDDLHFPGTNVDEIIQLNQDLEIEDEVPPCAEPILELENCSRVLARQYEGPPFPPVASAPQPSADILDRVIERKETLENKLINWVEQEIMGRIISGLYPLRQLPVVPHVSHSESEESEALPSDTAQMAGGGGVQLFIDAGLPVSSDTISQFVTEALAETVAAMLGARETRRPAAVAAGTSWTPRWDSSLPTPVATPQPTPPPSHSQSPSSQEKESSPVKTPELSPCPSEQGGVIPSQEQAAESVGTPTVTPAATPPREATPAPPPTERSSASPAMPISEAPKPWGDVDLSLDKENPSSFREEPLYPRSVVMSVAKEEEPENLIFPAPRDVVLVNPPPVGPGTPSPAPVPSSSPSTQDSSSSTSVTESETLDRPISEGEVIFGNEHIVAARAVAEEELSLTNLNDSSASTLHDAHEVEDDPPSEGQVIKRPHKGYHRDPILSLLTKLNQGPVVSQQAVCHLEDSENSIGELSEGQRPRLTAAAESLLTGGSLHVHPPTVARSWGDLPWKVNRVTGEVLGYPDASRGPMSLGELESQPHSNLPPPPPPPTSAPLPRAPQPTCGSEIDLPDEPQESSQKKQEKKIQPILPAEQKSIQTRVIRVRNRSETSLSHLRGDLDRTPVEPNIHLRPFLAGGEAMPHLISQAPAAKLTTTLPPADVDDGSVSISTGDGNSSGADTF